MGTLRIQGNTAQGEVYQQEFSLTKIVAQNNPAIAQLWGRARIKHLMGEMYGYEKKTEVEAVTETALSYQLLSQYTAFVAVSEEVRVNPDGEKVTVNVPLEIPDGVSYEGVFGTTPPPRPPIPIGSSIGGLIHTKSMPRAYYIQPLTSSPSISDKSSDVSESFSSPLFPTFTNIWGKITKSKKKANEAENKIQIKSVTLLDETAKASLTKHLQSIQLPPGIKGEVTLEFDLDNKRVRNVMVDELKSTIKNAETIELIKRSLFTWQVSPALTGKVELTLTLST